MDFNGFTILTPEQYLFDIPGDVGPSRGSIPSNVVFLFEGGRYLGAFLSVEQAQAFVIKLLEFRRGNSNEQPTYANYRQSLSGESQDLIKRANKTVKDIEWEMDDLDSAPGMSPT